VSALAALQRDFLAALLSDSAPADARMEVYRRAALARWHGALAAAYPVVRRLVGEAFFLEAATRYARAEPSSSGDLGEYGGAFPSFLHAYPHARPLPYLADVARLEWAVHESSRAEDAPACDFGAFGRLPGEAHDGVRFLFHPAVRWLASGHAVVALWHANQPERDGTPDRTAGPDHALVVRDAGAVRVERLPGPDWRFLAALARGEPLKAACEVLDDEDLPRALARLSAPGLLRGFEPPAPA
jgi:hypothetical protein